MVLQGRSAHGINKDNRAGDERKVQCTTCEDTVLNVEAVHTAKALHSIPEHTSSL